MAKHIFSTPVKIVICIALTAVTAVGAFADYQTAREYNFNAVSLITSGGAQFMHEIKYLGQTSGNYRFSDTLHANGVYRYDSATYTGGQLSVPYPPYSPVYVDYLYQSENVPNPSNGFDQYDFLNFACRDIDLTIPEGYTYIDFEAVAFKGSFVGFSLQYEMNGQNESQTLTSTSPNVHSKVTTYLPNMSQAQSYAVTSSVARYVIDVTGIIPQGATLKSIIATLGIPRIPITQAVYSATPASRRHVNYIMYITPVYITVNETDISRILYETQIANDTLTLIESSNREIREAIIRNERYERMVADFLERMGQVQFDHEIQPEVNVATNFFNPLFHIDPIPSMLGLTVSFIFLAAFIRKA